MQESAQHTPEASAIPFDTAKLDRLMEEAGIDVLLTTSKHNVQYLLAQSAQSFSNYMDALGVQPLFAGRGLSQGRARQGSLHWPSARNASARCRAALDS